MALNFGRTLVMGILNVTPDSFYDGGRYKDFDKACERARQMRDEGADIIDVGGESTRPGSKRVPAQEEIDRVCPVIDHISRNLEVMVSVDTYKSAVADAALSAGAAMVNDISGLSFDGGMGTVVADHGAYVVLMHIKGTPETMQDNPHYDNLIIDIYNYLHESVDRAIQYGIPKDKIVIDPGIGFGKTFIDNYTIIRELDYFKKLGYPIMVGLSMKSLIKNLYDEECDRLPATIALNAIAVINGASIVRVHDPKSNRLALAAVDTIKGLSKTDGSRI